MSAESAVLRGRMLAERDMGDTFTAYSPNGRTVVNGLEVPAYTSQGSTPGKVQGGTSNASDTATEYMTVGGVRRPILRGGLHIPIAASLPVAGDSGHGWEYLCTAATESTRVGRRYLVVNVPDKTYATARRLDVVEL